MKLRYLLSLAIILICLGLSKSKLLFVLEQYRHGARITIFQEQYGYNKMSSVTSLTKVGMQQHYNIGMHHRYKYIDYLEFLPKQYNPDVMKVISTNVERTKMSAMSHIYGIYPNIFENSSSSEKTTLSQDNFNLDQIQSTIQKYYSSFYKYFTSTPDEDYLFRYYDTCQKLRDKRIQWYQSEGYRKLNLELEKQFPNLLGEIQAVTGDYFLDFSKICKLRDNLECLKYEGIELDPGFTPELMRQLEYVAEVQEFSMIKDDVVFRYHNSRIMYYIFDWLDKKIANQTQVQWVSLSAHDTNLYLLMPFLGVNSLDCFYKLYHNQRLDDTQNCGSWPKFASNFVLELHEIDNKHYIQLLYNGEYMKLCNTTSHLCLYKTWKDSFKNKLVDKYKLDEMCPKW